MSKITKIIAGIFVVAIIGGLIFINTLDVNQYKGDIVDAVKQSTGRTLQIGGDLDFSLLFVPSIKVEDVKFSNAAWGSQPDMVKVNKLELQVALLPLLSGDIQIKRLVLIDPDILLETNNKGTANWEFSAPKAEKKEAAETEESTTAVSVNEVQIQNAKINYIDGVSGQKTKLVIDQITTQSKGLSNELAIFAKANYNDTPIEISGVLTLAEQNYALQELSLKYGNIEVNGTVSTDLSAKRPLITAKLHGKQLAFAESSDDETATEEKPDKKERVFSADPLPLEGLKAANADIELTLDQIKTSSLQLNNTQLTAHLKDGKLSIKPMKSVIAGGQLDGVINLNASGKSALLTADITIKGLEPSQIGDLNERISGVKTDVKIKAKGAGNSVSQIMAGLNGQFLVQSGGGEIKGVGTKLASTDLLTMLNPTIEGGDTTSLTCSVINFNIKDGLATTDKGIALMMKQMDVVGSGTIDLKTEKLDISLKPHPREGLGLSVGQFADLVSIGGTLADPSPTTNLTSVVTTGLKVQTAVVTGGLSLLAQGLFDRVTADEDPCKTALGIKPAEKADSTTDKTTESESDSNGGITDKIKGLFR